MRNSLNTFFQKQKHKNKAVSKPGLSAEDRIWLRDLYAKDVYDLKKMTGLSFKEWADFL